MLRLSDVVTLDLIVSVRVLADIEGVCCCFLTERRRLERLNVAETAAAALRLTADFCTVTDRQTDR